MTPIKNTTNSELFSFIKKRIPFNVMKAISYNGIVSRFNYCLIASLDEIKNHYNTLNDVALACNKDLNELILNEHTPVSIKSFFKYIARLKLLHDTNEEYNTVIWKEEQETLFRKILNNLPYKTVEFLIKEKAFNNYCNAVRANLPEKMLISEQAYLIYVAKDYPFGLIDFTYTVEGYSYWWNIYKKHFYKTF